MTRNLVNISFVAKSDQMTRHLETIRTTIETVESLSTAVIAERIKPVVGAIQIRNFDETRRDGGWPSISPWTYMFSRKRNFHVRKVANRADVSEIVKESKNLRPLVDTGRLRNSLKGGVEFGYDIKGRAIRFFSKVPYAAKMALGGSSLFANDFKWKKESKKDKNGNVVKFLRPLPTRDDKRLRRLVENPRIENDFYADRIRKYMARNTPRTRTVPARPWIRPFTAVDMLALKGVFLDLVADAMAPLLKKIAPSIAEKIKALPKTRAGLAEARRLMGLSSGGDDGASGSRSVVSSGDI